uniref:HDC12020 n=1 Tax=Drosophila melanogaster TaxID=7227 RepID=Q6IKN6_DROME|nr:TPA_inf: HDC12020 [Drosophila melanogaster]
MVENGRKTAKARSKNVCNAGCCALFPATTTHFPPASTVSPGRQNKLDSTVGNQLAPAPNTGEHVAQSLPSALRFSFLFAAPPPGQRKYLAVNVLSTNSSFQYEMSHLFYGRGPRLKPHFFFVLRSCHFLWPWPVIDLARFAGLLSQELSCQELLRSRSPLPCSHSDNELKCFATHFNKNTYTYTAGYTL